MPSSIPLNLPADGVPVSKGDLRTVFGMIKSELESGGFVTIGTAERKTVHVLRQQWYAPEDFAPAGFSDLNAKLSTVYGAELDAAELDALLGPGNYNRWRIDTPDGEDTAFWAAMRRACDQAALDGRDVFIPAGTWKVNRGIPLLERHRGLTVHGAGIGRTILQMLPDNPANWPHRKTLFYAGLDHPNKYVGAGQNAGDSAVLANVAIEAGQPYVDLDASEDASRFTVGTDVVLWDSASVEVGGSNPNASTPLRAFPNRVAGVSGQRVYLEEGVKRSWPLVGGVQIAKLFREGTGIDAWTAGTGGAPYQLWEGSLGGFTMKNAKHLMGENGISRSRIHDIQCEGCHRFMTANQFWHVVIENIYGFDFTDDRIIELKGNSHNVLFRNVRVKTVCTAAGATDAAVNIGQRSEDISFENCDFQSENGSANTVVTLSDGTNYFLKNTKISGLKAATSLLYVNIPGPQEILDVPMYFELDDVTLTSTGASVARYLRIGSNAEKRWGVGRIANLKVRGPVTANPAQRIYIVAVGALMIEGLDSDPGHLVGVGPASMPWSPRAFGVFADDRGNPNAAINQPFIKAKGLTIELVETSGTTQKSGPLYKMSWSESGVGWLLQNDMVAVPTSPDAPGMLGQWAVDGNHYYWHDGTRWQRVARDTTWT